jgi:hypothetical protein
LLTPVCLSVLSVQTTMHIPFRGFPKHFQHSNFNTFRGSYENQSFKSYLCNICHGTNVLVKIAIWLHF